MRTRLELNMLAQPDDFTCGPTCLQAVYRYYGHNLDLSQVIAEVPFLESGGTLAVLLACHALARGFKARIYTYNLEVFDPTWFQPNGPDIRERLRTQLKVKHNPKLYVDSNAYIEFLELGGELRFEDLTPSLIRKYLRRSLPILTGLSSTYLYRAMREYGPTDIEDDIRGEPNGHFVVLCGYDQEERTVVVADPLASNPLSSSHLYEIGIDRVINAILLGILTYDGNLLILEPKEPEKKNADSDTNQER